MGMDFSSIARAPIFFERNRVARVYSGGKLFHNFFGDEDADGHRPEEWIASSVRALNRGGDPDEGLSKVRGTGIPLADLLAARGDLVLGGRSDLGILVKVLDSAIRLPVQAHPDKPFSRRHFGSNYGKAEAWIVLATRENAKIHFGFKERMTKARFLQAVERSERDPDAMEALLNALPAKVGDVYFIPPKAVHAIGRGCLILEVQEPTDFTIQPEAWCGDYRLDDRERYLGLHRDVALDCFDYDDFGEAAASRHKKAPEVVRRDRGLLTQRLIGPGDTDCFAINRHALGGGAPLALRGPAVYIAVEGEGNLSGPDGFSRPLKRGDYFLMPACASGRYGAASETSMVLIECLPPMGRTVEGGEPHET